MNRMDALIHMPVRWLILLWLPWSLWSAPALAQLVFVTHEPLPLVQDLANRTAELTGQTVQVRLLAEQQSLSSQQYQAAVLVGPQALAGWHHPDLPAVAVFVSRADVAAAPVALVSAIYAEPPLTRQLALIRLLLGEDVPVGVLLQDRAFWPLSGLAGLDLAAAGVTPYYLSDYDSLNHALLALLRENRALLGVYDLQLYNAANIKTILISAYRRNIPLIGPGSAYLRAGALATTYSGNAEVARRLLEILTAGLQDGVWPAADYNPYFRVGFNPQVARSLNLPVIGNDELEQQLQSR